MLVVLYELNPQIVLLTEHDVRPNEIDRLNIDSYVINNYYCRNNTTKGGGVMILCKKDLQWKKVELPKSLKDLILEDKQFECCACKYSVGKLKILVIAIYRSPCSSYITFLDRLNKMTDFFSKKYRYIIFGGDININVLANGNDHKLLKNTLKSHCMRYLIDFPTRVTDTSKTAIDNFFIKNMDDLCPQVEGAITLLSDHDAQILHLKNTNLNNKKKNPLKKEVHNLSPKNLIYFKDLLTNETWNNVYLAPVDKKYDEFCNLFQYYFNQSFPKIKIVNKPKRNWISDDLKNEKKLILDLAKENRNNPNLKLTVSLKQKQKHFKNNVKTAKKMFFENKIKKSSNIQKTTWHIINSEVSNKNKNKHENIIIEENDCTVTNPKSISNMFNNYFINMVSNKKLSIANNDSTKTFSENHNYFRKMFNLKVTNSKEVVNVIKSLKNTNSTGFDDIPISIIKEVKYHLSGILTHLINSSFISGIFPNQLKTSKIIPIHKRDNPKKLSNYRPISLLPVISKIYEKIVNNQLTKYLDENKLLINNQHGFRPGKSVITGAVSFIESVIDSVDKGNCTIGIFMDLSKAFDSVDHSLLIDKLKLLGISMDSLNWFQSYLLNRNQFVEITHTTSNNEIIKTLSNFQTVKLGVPQGSILGPLLFLCYINNINQALSNNTHHNLCLYADDANLQITAETMDDLELHSTIEIENIGHYLENLHLMLNTDKTNFLQFKTKQNKQTTYPVIRYISQTIEKKSSTTFLGLNIDEHLSWDEHIHKTLSKISSGIYSLYRMSFFCTQGTLRSIYFANIHSHITFGCCLYGSTSKYNLDNILKQQKRAIRIILQLKTNETVKAHFKNLNILTVYGQYIYETILIARTNQKINETAIPTNTHQYNTRNKNEIIISHHNLKFFEKKPNYVGTKFIKNLPAHIKNEEKLKKFKKILKKYLTEKCLYSLDEYFTMSQH